VTPEPKDEGAAAVHPYDGAVAFEDLTARARIREAALNHFAEDGYERSTIRRIAQSAGVSPGLLRHHYGSKEGLRKACDDHVVEMLHGLNAQILADPNSSVVDRPASQIVGRYVTRALADGSVTVGVIFDEMVTMTEQWLSRADEVRPDPPTIDSRTRAALITAMKVGIPLLHDHVSRALGTDMFEAEGERRVALALIDIYSHKLPDDRDISVAKARFGAGGA
jgi:AcrR family transcriptional regulator